MNDNNGIWEMRKGKWKKVIKPKKVKCEFCGEKVEECRCVLITSK